MSDAIFDLEQEIMQCWHVVNDIDMITKHFVDDPAWAGDHFSAEATDALMNKYFAIKELYEVKFDHLFKTFEKVSEEYHRRGKLAQVERNGQLDTLFDEIDIMSR